MSQTTESVRALLVDGEQIELRPAIHADEFALIRLHDELSERSVYLRFFTINYAAGADFVHRLLELERPSGYCLVAVLAGEIVGMVSYQTLETPQRAEVALIVADRCQSRGVGTLLLEHVVSYARQHAINVFHAEVLAENSRMLRVFSDIGLTPSTRLVDGTLQVEIPLRYDDSYLDAIMVRERRADVASLTPLLEPTSVAVIGVSHRGVGAGYAVLTHLLEAGFHGPIHAVSPHAVQIAGVRAYPSVAEIPEPPELAVLAVPAAHVPDVAEQCGKCGVKALVVLSSGLTSAAANRLIDSVHRFGMRMVGPNCIGLANTEPTVALDASFTQRTAASGHVGIVTQSGGIGIALLESLAQAGLGVSTFVSTGDKYDVSSNDLLLWWGQDNRTKVAVVYVESFGNPRKFSRLARHVAAQTPIVAVRAAASPAAQRAAQSHTAASATPAVTRDALFRQAGVIPTDDLQETVEVVALLSTQPIPDGSRVAIISNAGGGGVLAADACDRYGLQLATISNRDALTALLGTAATVANPIDTSAGVSPDIFADSITEAAADPNVDAVLAIIAPTALGDLRGALDTAATKCAKPLL
ncbi:MAG: GNAT family N-acetyltransferase, partial [Mycobacterium sp.]|nr:GNAT family N-acetyltransferase [Mycobacterium sp.]